MPRSIDDLLNRVTMYRLVLYYLIFLLGAAVLLSALGVLKYDVYALLFSIGFLLAISWAANWIFARTFAVPANVESVYISALILALILSPIQSFHDLWFLGWAAVLAMASKYILAINRKHIFNPVALAVALTYFTVNQSASWWVGSAAMLPFVLLGGILLVRKLGRSDLVLSFLVTAIIVSLWVGLFTGANLAGATRQLFLSTPLLFFALVIVTEPLTAPPTHRSRIAYGALVGFFFSPQVHFGGFYFTPELAILIGNAFSYVFGPKRRAVLRLREKIRVAPDVYDFVFNRIRNFAFAPGQYMEWTLGHADPDGRGNRRYFTLASAPTEKNLRVGVKFSERSSSFKAAMLALEPGDEIIASQPAGDFVLPKDPHQKVVLIAGGVGVTPFRSMIKYMLDTHQRRPVVLFYANKTVDDILYKDVFDRAQHELGLRVIYAVSDPRRLPAGWNGVTGRITPQVLQGKLPDFPLCVFYISGPKGMVDSFKESLDRMGVPRSRVKTDYFSGLA
ncbi:MAG TPA: RnfABCDGE type electron transport complex subunit D [Anaerolineales bacterium]|nr:RnfABCDGE type electron transport complex subunit D [Anaerolineales bacterium]